MLKTVEKAPQKTGMSFEVTTITPTIAAAWLDKNTGNRKISQNYVKAYARERHAVSLGPAARLLLEIEKGTTTPLSSGSRGRVTHAEILDVVRRHPKLVASCAVVRDSRITGAHITTLIVIHYIAIHFLDNVEDAGNFVAVFKTGIPRYTGCAAHATRERFLRMKNETTQIPLASQSMLMIQAWNNFAARRQVQQVKTPSSVSIMGLDRNKLRKGTT